MDAPKETLKAKALLAVAVVFVASTVLAFNELRFAVSGRTAAATVDSVTSMGRRFYPSSPRGTRVLTVQYHYQDAEGNRHQGSDDLEILDAKPPVGGTVMVEYVGDSSRRLGHRNGGALMLFFGSGVTLVVGGSLFWLNRQQANVAGPEA